MSEVPFTLSLHEGFEESHLDLFLDLDGISRLITFGTVASDWDLLRNGSEIEFQRKTDHRRVYLDLEGRIEGKGQLKILLQGKANIQVEPDNVSGWRKLRATIKDGRLML